MQHGLPEQAIEPTASRTGANKLGYRAVKRAFDLTVTAMAVIVLSPLFLILSVIVYLGDPGAVIYGQVRIGKNGKPFKMWKFRSMYRNADQMIDQLSEEQKRQYHTEFKIDNDPRITPVGNFLRKTSLDELPQLFNVLAGDMSLVGPRPLLKSEIQQYYADSADVLLSVKPGRDRLLAGIRAQQCDLPERASTADGDDIHPPGVDMAGLQDSDENRGCCPPQGRRKVRAKR